MADVKTLRTQEELDLIEKTFGSTYLETQSFELSRRACLLQAQRDENARLLKAFTCENIVCSGSSLAMRRNGELYQITFRESER